MPNNTNNGAYAVAAALITASDALRSSAMGTPWDSQHFEDAWAVYYNGIKKHAEK